MSPPLGICLPRPSFVRKDSLKRNASKSSKRPTLSTQHSSSKSMTTIVGTPDGTQEKLPFSSVDTLVTREGSSRTATPTGLAPGTGFGWGKVINDGKLGLSVSTFTSSRKEKVTTPPPTPLAAEVKPLSTTARLAEIRALMKAEPDGGLDYYVVPSEDSHQSEYTAPSDRRREFISGFTGSAGTVVISRHEAYLFTDSRYYVQAAREIDTNWTLQKVGLPDVKPWNEWIKDRSRGSRVGIDSRLISHEAATSLSSALNSRFSKLVFPRVNLVDKIWKGRPAKSSSPIFILDTQFTGKVATEKLDELRVWIKSQRPPAPPVVTNKAKSPTSPTDKEKDKVDAAKTKPSPKPPQAPVATFVSNLASIAWLLNIRGSDVAFNPVTVAYLFVSTVQAILFVDKAKINKDVGDYLKSIGVGVRDYGDTWTFLRRAEWGNGKVLIDAKTPYAVSLMLTSARYTVAPAWIEQTKAIKNDVEIEGFRNAYLRDGAAMVKWYAWLEEQIKSGISVTEYEAAEELTNFRAEGEHFWGLAYENISASGPNAALPHYTAKEETAAFIDTLSPYLNDSGGQYLDGTCDTTRTVHFGFPTDEQMEAYTRVLQGHIAIDQAVFPEGTSGLQLDVLARKALWKEGLNYLHGTGHGIGSFLNVHEGPHGFGAAVALKPGMVISNEPGFYKEGHFGIRIESALVVRRVDTRGKFGGDVWLGFERLTQVPIQNKLVKMDLLTKDERTWLKDHNAQTRAKLASFLGDDKRASRWLRRETTKSGPSSAVGVSLQWD